MELLVKNVKKNGFHFVSNDNISRKYLCKDGVHLLDAGNTIDYIRQFISKEF